MLIALHLNNLLGVSPSMMIYYGR